MTDLGYFINILREFSNLSGIDMNRLMAAYPTNWQAEMGRQMRSIDRTRITNALKEMASERAGKIPSTHDWAQFLDAELGTFRFSSVWESFQKTTQDISKGIENVASFSVPAIKLAIAAVIAITIWSAVEKGRKQEA